MTNLAPPQKTNDTRRIRLQTWADDKLRQPTRLKPLAGDASFRRYFRVSCGDNLYIAMDAPPNRESCQPFVAIAKAFADLKLNVPVIYHADLDHGFLLLSDLGDRLFLDALNANTAQNLYSSAFDSLLIIQSCQNIPGYPLPHFDTSLYLKELSLFDEWYLKQQCGITLSTQEQATLTTGYQHLMEGALAQPQVCVHLDYHSRNLMVVPDSPPGILDFQDARLGPITYDLVSLLRDCYIDWPPEQVEQWALSYQQQALDAGILTETSPEQFLQWFDWIGLQRHLKCIGIFARLHLRDNKPHYLQYIPRIADYALHVCERYPELAPLIPFIERGRTPP